MRRVRQQAFAFAQRLAHQPDLSMFQITQSAVNDASGSAGGAGREIVLLNQQRALAPLRTLPSNSDAVDAAADYQNVKSLVLRLNRAAHAYIYLDAFSRKDNITSEHNVRRNLVIPESKAFKDLWSAVEKYGFARGP